jgi:O-antigen ligase
LTSSGRTLIWPVLIDAAWQAPWFGYGWNQVGRAQLATALAHPSANHWFTDSHNLVLDLVLWAGIPLGFLLAALLAWWFVRQVRRCTDPDRWALLLAISAVLLHAMVEYPHSYLYFPAAGRADDGPARRRAASCADARAARREPGLPLAAWS